MRFSINDKEVIENGAASSIPSAILVGTNRCVYLVTPSRGDEGVHAVYFAAIDRFLVVGSSVITLL